MEEFEEYAFEDKLVKKLKSGKIKNNEHFFSYQVLR
jgi:hypothetical protein